MENYLILPVIILASLLLSYVLAQDTRAGANRLFAAFMGSVILQGSWSLIRLTTSNESLAFFTTQTLGLTIALNQLLLMSLVLALFLPERYNQRTVRWLISLPYLVAIGTLLLDLLPGRSLWLVGMTPRSDGTFDLITRGTFNPLLIGLILGNLAPIVMLAAIAARHTERRMPAIILNAGCLVSLGIGFLPQTARLQILYVIGPVPIYLAFTWITLRYQIFRPSPIALETAIESLPEGVVFLDQQQRVLYANATAKRYLDLATTASAPSLAAVLEQANLRETQHVAAETGQRTRYVRDDESAQVIEGADVAVIGDRRDTRILMLRDISAEEQHMAALQAALGEVEIRAAEQNRLLGELTRQREAIRELSIPILPIASDIVVLPLVGALDAERLQQVQERALKAIERSRARQLILDITGVPVFDTLVARGIMNVVQAGQLLGAHVALVGVRPEVAQAIVSLGIRLDGIVTFATLQEAIAGGSHHGALPQRG